MIEIAINRAAKVDLEEIFDLSRAFSLDRMDEESARLHGFLLSNFSKDQYREYIRRADHFYVARQNETRIDGFVLAYSSSKIDTKKEWTNTLLTYYFAGSFVLIKQICVWADSASNGIGSQLYNHLLEEVQGIPAVTAIVNKPRNERSERFHEKLGFRPVLKILPKGEEANPRVIWRNENGGRDKESRLIVMEKEASDPYAELKIKKLQYQMAVELYKHEDLLNWSKLGALFVAWAFLGTALLYVWENFGAPVSDTDWFFFLTLVVLGTILNTIFAVALHSGGSYMEARKEKAVELESDLANIGAATLVGIIGKEKNSPTLIIIKKTGFIGIAIWVICCLVTLFRMIG